jgi:uridine kinase
MSDESVGAFESVSTWQQAMPAEASAERGALLELLAAEICGIGDTRLRVAIDGYTAAGKTSFGHELAAGIRRLGRHSSRSALGFEDETFEALLGDLGEVVEILRAP